MSLFMTCSTFAEQLTPNEALNRMQSEKAYAKGYASPQNDEVKLVYSSSFKGNNTYYVFNKAYKSGFLILSADDCMPAVLGEVEGSDFDMSSIPANMRWWLSEYDKVISEYIAKGKKYISVTPKKDISPLLNSLWNQSEPYNAMCPIVKQQRCVTGCVPTAMAQIMRKHQWPEKGTGKDEYRKEVSVYDEDGKYKHDTIQIISSDFSRHTYDWNNMLDIYDENSTETQKNAVALLMSDCGVAAHANYTPTASGAFVFTALKGMVNFFNYDPSARILSRSIYTDEEWEDLVYEDLSNDMPVFYVGGGAQNDAHAFVCDGYKAEGNMYHINWGWGGLYHGYFLLTGNNNEVLCPSSSYNFSASQIIIKGLKPASKLYRKGDEGAFRICIPKHDFYTTLEPANSVIAQLNADDYQFRSGKGKRNADGSLTVNRYTRLTWNGLICHEGYTEHQFAIAFKFSSNANTYYIKCSEEELGGQIENDRHFHAAIHDIPINGTYTVTLVYKDLTAGETEWHEMPALSDSKPTVIHVTGDEPYMYITDTPKVTSGGKSTEDNLVTKSGNSVDINIQLQISSLQTVNKHTIVGYIYESDGFVKRIGKLYENINYMAAEESQTINLTSAKSNGLNLLTVGKMYDIVFFDVANNNETRMGKDQINCITIQIVNTATGIQAIVTEPDNANKAIYDLNGHKVTTTRKGMPYIINGKKVLVDY